MLRAWVLGALVGLTGCSPAVASGPDSGSAPVPSAPPGTHAIPLAAAPAAAKPIAPPPWMPTASRTVLVGGGDIASCSHDRDETTARLVEQVLAAVPTAWAFTAGDNVYPTGSLATFASCYAPTWGRFRDRTLAVPGNHDWADAGAAGFRAFFHAPAAPAPLWRAVNVGSWRVLLLDSDCTDVGGCTAESAQGAWLAAELARNPSLCTLAVWHHPRFSSGPHGDTAAVDPLWRMLANAGAELVVSGHDHLYERFAPRDADGRAAPDGLVQLVAGTGGAAGYPVVSAGALSTVRLSGESGVVVLTLGAADYHVDFVNGAGEVLDRSDGICHPNPLRSGVRSAPQ